MLGLIVALALVSCAPPAQTETPEPPTAEPAEPEGTEVPPTAEPAAPEPEAVELEFWYEWDETNNPEAYAWSQQVIEAFEAEYPGITVDAEAIPDQQYNTKFQTAVAGGTPPDGFMVRPGGWSKVYVDEGVILPLDTYLDEGGWGDTFIESALSVCEFDGQVYCLPGGIRTVQVWYNQGLFDELGLEPPTTWAELEAVAQALIENDVIPFALGNKEGWEAPLIYEYLLIRSGGYDAFVSATARDGSAKFNDPVFVEAAQKLVDMQEAGWFPEGANGLEFGEMLGQFFNGDAAMAVFLNVMPGIAGGMAPEGFELAFFEFPVLSDDPVLATGMVGSIGGAWAISASSEHPDEMAEFLRFWTSTENMTQLSQDAGWTMSVKDTVSEETASEMLLSFAAEISNADHIIPFLDYALLPDTSAEVFQATQQLLDGSLEPQAAMDLWEAAAAEEYGK
jgi:raffinose/stachyose/melibiose transport system substrate-binding protein